MKHKKFSVLRISSLLYVSSTETQLLLPMTKGKAGSHSPIYHFISPLLDNDVVNCSRSNFGIVIKTKLTLEQVYGYLHVRYNRLRQKVLHKSNCQSSLILLWGEGNSSVSNPYTVHSTLASVFFNIIFLDWIDPHMIGMSEWLF